MSSSLSGLFRRNRTLSFGLLALLLVSALFLLVTPPTSADSPVEDKGDKDSILYADAKRAALSEAIASVEPSSEEVESMAFTPCVDGMADIFPCNKVDLMAFMTLDDLGGSPTNDIWGWTDEDGNEYALIGRNNGTSFVDVTDPVNPVFLGELPGHNGSSSNWRDVKVYSDHAFIVSEASGDGMQVFDLSRLTNVANPPETFTEDAYYDGFGSAHNIVINEDSGYAYGVGTATSDGCAGGLHMVNIQNPLEPTNAGCFADDGYTHDAQCVNYMGPDADYADSEICLNSNEDTLTIVDVSDKDNPVQLARATYPNPGYTHQGWLTEDQRYFLQNDETDETSQGINTRTLIWDLEDLDNPVYMGHHDSGNPASDHNLYIRDNYTYQSNYASGLRILDITDIANANLELAGYFDVWPETDAAGFDGSWSNYPYFDSGNIIVTSRGLGFMVVKTSFEPDFSVTATPDSLDVCVATDAVYTVNVGQNEGFSDPVTLNTSGAPAGAGIDFSMNGMAPPFTSTLTITTTNAAPGNYDIDIVGMASPTHTHTTTVGLDLANAVPSTVTLMMPADMATDVSRSPTFEWMGVDGATSYHLEVASDMDFNDVMIDVTLEDVSYEAEASLDGEAMYYWRVTAMNGCGAGTPSAAFSFTTEAVPPILVVDDQNANSNELSAYTDALDALGEAYDVFDTGANAGLDPTAEQLAPYLKVIWFSGADFSATAGPDPTGEAELGTYLDDNADRCLFISGQDYLWGQGGGSAGNPTAFMMEYLGLESTGTDVIHANVSGAGAFVLLQPDTLAYPFTNYSDELNPDDTAAVAFTGDGSGGTNAGISKVTDNYRTTYWGFPFEAIPSAGEREDTMRTVLEWCDGVEIETGMLDGTVTDADSEEPIEGAMVMVDNDTYTFSAMTDENGDYSMEVVPGMYDVMAEAEGYASDMASDVEIMANETMTLDFMLAGSHLTYDPDMIEEEMVTDEMVTTTIMLTNTGPLDVEFDLIPYNYEGPMLQVRGSSSSNLLGASEAFGINLGDDQSVTFMTDDPANVTTIGATSQNFYGGDFLGGDFTTLYAVDNAGMMLYAIDTITGDMTAIGDTAANDGQSWTGMAGDPTDGTMYGMSTDCTTNTLYTINVVTGEPTTIGTDDSGPCIIAIAINAAGELYGADLGDNLVSIDKSTGAITIIGALGVDINNAQGMDFDEEADILYLAAFNGGGLAAELRTVDTTTGASTVVGQIGNGNAIDSLAIATGGGDSAPNWATAHPDGGMIPANSTMMIDVVFNSTGITETGTYSASLRFNGTYVNDVADMPLVMHLVEYDDGITDETEDGGPNDGDANGDGVDDSDQDEVASLPNAGDDEGYVTLEVPEGVAITDVEASPAPMTLPTGVENMPQGVLDFTLEGVEVGTGVTLTLYIQNSDTPMDAYWKYDEENGWTDYEHVTYGEAMVGGETVTTLMIYLEDGGVGDHDGVANGTIVDPGAPVASTPTNISLAGFDSQANVLWQPVALLALLLLAVMAGGAVMLRKRGLA